MPESFWFLIVGFIAVILVSYGSVLLAKYGTITIEVGVPYRLEILARRWLRILRKR